MKSTELIIKMSDAEGFSDKVKLIGYIATRINISQSKGNVFDVPLKIIAKNLSINYQTAKAIIYRSNFIKGLGAGHGKKEWTFKNPEVADPATLGNPEVADPATFEVADPATSENPEVADPATSLYIRRDNKRREEIIRKKVQTSSLLSSSSNFSEDVISKAKELIKFINKQKKKLKIPCFDKYDKINHKRDLDAVCILIDNGLSLGVKINNTTLRKIVSKYYKKFINKKIDTPNASVLRISSLSKYVISELKEFKLSGQKIF